MGRGNLQKSDVIESFIRSSGPGGQHVNKTASCVQLIHVPTGIIVKCQEFRSQDLNRKRAWELLAAKLDQRQEQREAYQKAIKAKKRRQEKKPSRASKEKTLEQKKKHSFKKRLRSRIKESE